MIWHRARAKALFGFDYKIEVYTPAAKRVHGYYTLPILHNGRLIGRLDPKHHRLEKILEVRGAHYIDKPDEDALNGVSKALNRLGEFLAASAIHRGPLSKTVVPA